MKKSKKILLILLLCISIFIHMCIFSGVVTADVGSFEDYSGGDSWGSSWSDSSWDSDSSWGDSSWDSGGDVGSFIDFIWLLYIFMEHPFLVIFMVVLAIICKKIQRKKGIEQMRKNEFFYGRQRHRVYTPSASELETRQVQIENKIQMTDPNFNKEEFIAWSKNLFVKLQQAWTDRDWSVIRTFETESLFEQHKNQLQGYITNNQINVMDRICVNYAHLYAYRQEGDKEVLTVRLNSRMQDYIIDATTKEVIKGDKETERVNTYLLTFIRKNGIKTKEGTAELNTTNCPNCGAPTQITSAGKCEYCGSVITTGEYDWVLSNLERENAAR